MRITHALQTPAMRNTSPAPDNGQQGQEPAAPVDSVGSSPSEPFLGGWGPTIATAAVLGGLGVYAGLGEGVLAAGAGMVAGAAGGSVVGAAGSARLGFSEQSFAVGLAGLAVGGAAGAAVGLAGSSPVGAVVFGALGLVGGAFYGAMSGWVKD